MKTINKYSSIRVLWKIFRGNNKISEDFHSPNTNVKVFLVGSGDTYYYIPTVNTIVDPGYDVLEIDIPSGKLIEGVYDIKAIWVKNNERNVLTSIRSGVLAITDSLEEAPVQDEEIKIASYVESFGRDGMTAYELAVMRGITELSEKDWLQGLDLQDGSVTEEKLSSEVVKKLNNKANRASDVTYQSQTGIDGKNVEEALNTVGTRLQSLEQPSTAAANLYVSEIVHYGQMGDYDDPNDGAMPPLQTGDVVFMTAWGKFGYRVTGRKDTTSGYTVYTNATIVTKDGYKASDYAFVNGETKVFYCGSDKKSYTWSSTGNALVEYGRKSSITLEDLTPTMANIDNVREEVNTITKEVTTVTDEVQNISDEEDLTRVQQVRNGKTYEVLQLKDREFAEGKGMGYVILRKGDFKSQVEGNPNTIFEVRYDFDLNGEEVTIPANCVLKFEGGKISNGSLIGGDTRMSAPQTEIFNNITIKGTWEVPTIYQSWFNFARGEGYDNLLNFQNMMALTSADVVNNVYYNNGDYYTSVTSETILLKSNTTLNFGACHIVEIPHGHNYRNLVVIKECSSVNVYGGILTGDAVEHNYDSGEHATFEHCHGIKIGKNAKNITIKDTTIEKMTGDGIDIVSDDESIYGIVIDNVVCSANNRQGLSIESGINIKVTNSEFVDTSSIHVTAPGAGIDIEPYINTASVSDVIIDNCKLRGNKGNSQLLIQANVFKDDNTYDNKIRLSNLVIDGKISAVKTVNIDISNVSLTEPITITGCASVRLSDCKLSGLTFVSTEDINVEKTTSTASIDFNYGENVTINRLSSDIALYSGVKNVSINDSTIPKLHLESTDNLGINYCEIGELKWQNASNVVLSKSKIITHTSQGDAMITDVNISECDLGTITFAKFRFSDTKIAKSKLAFNKIITTEGTSDIHIEDCSISAIGQIKVSSSSWHLSRNRIIFTGDGVTSAILLVGSGYSINLTDNIFENCKSIITTNFGNEIINIKSEQAIPITTDNWVTKCVNPKEGCVERQGISVRRFIGDKWISDATINAGTDRPIGVEVGYSYFDTSISKPIYWIGTKWVDATGTEV